MRRILGLILLFIPVFAASVFAQGRTVLFPRFASGVDIVGGTWACEFFLTNQGFSAVEDVSMYFIGSDGNNLSVVTNLGTNSQFTFDLAAGVTQVIRLTPGGTLVDGHVQVVYPDFTTPVRGSMVYRYEKNGAVLVEVGLPQQEIGDHFSFPVAMNAAQSLYTAFGLTNPTNSEQTFVVTLNNASGTLSDTTTVTLGALEHTAGYVHLDLFPQLNNTVFTGSISVSSQFGAGVMTLRQDKDAFGGTSTDGGPIMPASFLVTTPTTTDADGVNFEINDYFEDAQALTLPVRVSGTIGYGDDWDIYAFNGQAGQILTVICDTTQVLAGSYTDSIVRVFYGGADNEIAFNDQNGFAPGLYPLDDSFVQIELPFTGTYYVTVYDYWEDAGDTANYQYYLHMRVR